MACATKLYSNSHLDELLVEFENNARANGAHVYWARMRMSIVILSTIF